MILNSAAGVTLPLVYAPPIRTICLIFGIIAGSIRIAIAAIRKHAPNCGIPPEMLGQLLASLRDFARTHPGWLLVDITTHKGDIVKITL